jgi:hypothetical protein
MGATESKSTSEVMNEYAVDVVQRTIQNCTTTATQTQIMEVGYVGGDVDLSSSTFTQGASINMTCALSDQKTSEIANKLANDVVQFAESKSKGLLVPPGGTEAEIINNITNDIKTSLTQESVQNSAADTAQYQKIGFGFVEGNFVARGLTMSQTAEVIAKSIVDTAMIQTIINDVSNKVDLTTSTESTGAETAIAEGLFGMLGAWAYGVIGVVIVIALLLFGFMFYFFFGGSEQQQRERRQWVSENANNMGRRRRGF